MENIKLENSKELELIRIVGEELNNYSFNANAFAAGIPTLHPTVQQLFFKLVKSCLLFMADGNVRIDERNRASYELCCQVADIVRYMPLPMV